MSTYAQMHTKPVNNLPNKDWHEWAREVYDIYTVLCDADRPLSVKELQPTMYLSSKSICRRLDDLIVVGHVRRREDGPDGRVSYFEPTDRVHHCNGEWWEPKPVRLEGNNGD